MEFEEFVEELKNRSVVIFESSDGEVLLLELLVPIEGIGDKGDFVRVDMVERAVYKCKKMGEELRQTIIDLFTDVETNGSVVKEVLRKLESL